MGIELLFAVISVFMSVYLLLAPITLAKKQVTEKPQFLIYVATNGVHTDLLVPIHSEIMDWEDTLKLQDELKVDTFQTHFKFGWGDKNFFLKTKDWSDLTVGTAVNTVFGSGPGAMHLVLCTPKDLDQSQLIPLYLTKKQFVQLTQFLHDSFLWKDGIAQQIVHHPYGTYDLFFDSSLTYSMRYTCNSWTNSGLQAAEQRSAFWAPFKGIIYSKYGH
jgi:uncharacterized protein (TIGR02117 family)